tara:strand:- start:7 stop:216 length:210 start_codon:yes stop_codon:yes gene_type:complete
MKKNVNGKLVDMTEQEISEIETRENLPEAQGNVLTEEKMQAKADLKASARSKLIAGDPLTEEEAATIVP